MTTDDYLRQNDALLQDARATGDNHMVESLLLQRQRALDEYLESARQQDARKEAFRQGQREHAERMRQEGEKRQAIHHAKEMRQIRFNAEIVGLMR